MAGSVHEGHGQACYYIDDRCTDRQFEVLSDIITGRPGNGSPFSVYSSIIEEYDEPKTARIKFEPKDIRSSMCIHAADDDDDIIHTSLEPTIYQKSSNM